MAAGRRVLEARVETAPSGTPQATSVPEGKIKTSPLWVGSFLMGISICAT